MSETHAPQKTEESGESGPAPSAATTLATSAAEVYADKPFAGTIFEKSGRSRSWLDTIPEERPTRLSEVMQDHNPSGKLILELQSGESVEVQVGKRGGEKQEASGHHTTAEKRESWREEGRKQVRKKKREEIQRIQKRHNEELQIKEERLQQVRERNSQLQNELHETRRRKERQIEEERTKRREREEELEEKYKSRIEELEEKNRELKDQLLEQKASDQKGWVGEVVDLVKEDSQIQALLAQGVAGSQSGAQSGAQPQRQQARQNAPREPRRRQPQEASPQPVARGSARGDGAPRSVANGGPQSAGTEPTGAHPTEENAQNAPRGQSDRQPGNPPANQERPQSGPQRGAESGLSGEDQGGGGASQEREGEGEPSEVAQVAADCLESILTGQAKDFSERLRSNESVQEWGEKEWTAGLHGLAIIATQNEIPAAHLGDFVAYELPYWAGEDTMAQVRAMQGLPASQTVGIMVEWMGQHGEEVSDPVRQYLQDVVKRLQAHDL